MLEQRSAADTGDGALAVEPQKQLIAHQRAAADEAETIEPRMRADGGGERGNMQRRVTLPDHFDVVDVSVVTGKKFKRGVDLIVASCRSFVTLNQHDAGAVIDDRQ